MFFQHIYDKTLAQASYLIGCQVTGEAIVIDAQRDVDVYLEVAQRNNLKITKITETHIHADFLSGSRELAALTGAELYLSDEGGADWQYEFPHHGLHHGDKIKIGNLSLEVMHTPGHTPESVSFLLTDHPATDEPVMIFTGDFVFVGDIGRPDLLEKAAGLVGTQDVGAKQMYESIQRFAQLPDYIQVWPGHGAGSACGKSLGAVPSSTVGYEKIRNWAFRFKNDQDSFVENLLDGQPEPPKYFAKMKVLNKVARPLLPAVPQHSKLSVEQFIDAYEKGVPIIDTRHKDQFAQGYLPGSINIQGNNSFANWMGWIMNYDEPFILIADEDEMEDLTRKLMRIGMDQIMGYFTDLKSLQVALSVSDLIDYEGVVLNVGNSDVQIVDLRSMSEFQSKHIPGADHVFIGALAQNLDKISREKPVIIHCQSGDRSTIGYSILKKHGFEKVQNYSGSMKDWNEKSKK